MARFHIMAVPTLQLDQVYAAEADRLRNARSTAHIIHKSGDIDASGDEFENAFRDFLRRRLPAQYYVGHGHIVDRNGTVSPQFDVIITDGQAAPILFEGKNGTSYFPYESVYAIGELKTTYADAKKQIQKFADKAAQLSAELTREVVGPTYIGNGVSIGPPLVLANVRPQQNLLFKFICFNDRGDLKATGIRSEYRELPDDRLPNISFFLNGLAFIKTEVSFDEGKTLVGKIVMEPGMIMSEKGLSWMEVSYSDILAPGAILALFMIGLWDHLNKTRLERPHLYHYLQSALAKPNNCRPIALKEGDPIAEKLGFSIKVDEQSREFHEYYLKLLENHSLDEVRALLEELMKKAQSQTPKTDQP